MDERFEPLVEFGTLASPPSFLQSPGMHAKLETPTVPRARVEKKTPLRPRNESNTPLKSAFRSGSSQKQVRISDQTRVLMI
jgi:hypothetical protein